MKFALRQLAKSPGFAAVAGLSLALGIGANTAVFSLMKAVLLSTLPVRNPDALVVFSWVADENVGPPGTSGWSQRDAGPGKRSSTSFSIHTFEQFRAHATTLSDVFAFAPIGSLHISIDGEAETVWTNQVASGNYHAALGVGAAAGRLLTPADDDPGAEAVAVISHQYWQRRLGGEHSAIGKPIQINGVPVTIVGVTAPNFAGTMQVGEVVNVTLPLAAEPRISRRGEEGRKPTYWWVRIMGRLKPGVLREQARASLEGVFHETAKPNIRHRPAPGAKPLEPGQYPLPQLRADHGGQGLYEARRNYERPLNLLMGLVGLVLVVACANVANLLLARGSARRREIAVRLALGASRGRIVRQLLAESLLLAAIGATAGIVVAIWGSRALLALQPFGPSPLSLDLSLDWRVLGFTTLLAGATSVLFGLAPALRATRINLNAEFQGGTRTLGAGSRSALAKVLMIVQVALSLVLLIGAGLFVRTLRNLESVDVGFNRERLLMFGLDAHAAGFTEAQISSLYARVRDRIAQVPGVTLATFARVAPLSQSNWTSGVTVPGYTPTRNENVNMNGVEPDYFATLGTPLLRGRNFTLRDDAKAPKAAVVNQTFARKYFSTEDVVGRRFSTGGRSNPTPDTEIVGVVRDFAYSTMKNAPPATVFLPYMQLQGVTVGSATFVLRLAAEPGAVTPSIRAAVREIDANLPLENLRTVEEQVGRLLTQERLFARLCSFFGVLALLLAAVGLYGLMSYSVVRRTGEIGLRMALGAVPGRVLLMVVRESLALVVLGVLIGIAAAFGATKWISSMLFGLPPNDPATYALVVALMLIVATFACLLPARRAAKVDPMMALRME
jgi:predicted permease